MGWGSSPSNHRSPFRPGRIVHSSPVLLGVSFLLVSGPIELDPLRGDRPSSPPPLPPLLLDSSPLSPPRCLERNPSSLVTTQPPPHLTYLRLRLVSAGSEPRPTLVPPSLSSTVLRFPRSLAPLDSDFSPTQHQQTDPPRLPPLSASLLNVANRVSSTDPNGSQRLLLVERVLVVLVLASPPPHSITLLLSPTYRRVQPAAVPDAPLSETVAPSRGKEAKDVA